MKCFSPFPSKYGLVPCGHCLACKVNRSEFWVTRLEKESIYWDRKSFLTLTYNNENLPHNSSLVKKDLQLFIKLLRSKGLDLKYYGVGEYGDRFNRPHYHMILFGLNSGDKRLIDDCWKKGFVKVDICLTETIRYTCKYIHKKLLGNGAKMYYKKLGIEAPFAIMSKKIGYRWLMDNLENVIDNEIGEIGIIKKGKRIPLPRYYYKILDDMGLISDKIKESYVRESIARRLIAMVEGGYDEHDEGLRGEEQRDQAILDLNGRMDILDLKRKGKT